jgi:NADH pyrophosphatase NudC (nudix superfamily)
VSKFYIGFLNQNITVHRFDIMKAKEIEQQKWVTMNELKTLNSKTFLENLVKPAKKLIKKYRKGKFNIEL